MRLKHILNPCIYWNTDILYNETETTKLNAHGSYPLSDILYMWFLQIYMHIILQNFEASSKTLAQHGINKNT